MELSESERIALCQAKWANPHMLLGMHDTGHGIVVRALVQDAKSCSVLDTSSGKIYPMERLDDAGLFEVLLTKNKSFFPYQFRIEDYNGEVREIHDPYRFLPTLSTYDAYLFNEGKNHWIHHHLGAHPKTVQGIEGVSFAVWAPNAQRVSVVGDFNRWDGRYHVLRPLGSSGIWEIFIPGLESGELYKYEIWDANGHVVLKSDPYANAYESPPNNASRIVDLEGYEWHDSAWLARRAQTKPYREPLSIYEVHLGSWKRVPEDGNRYLNYVELGEQLADYCQEMGFTHVEFLPVMEHPFAGSWGYQVTGFFAPTHRYGSPQQFMQMVDHLHQRGIGVILDWVPGHFPKDRFALAQFDGTHLYEPADTRVGEHKEWGTLIFNYGRSEVRNFLISSALSWCERYHIDGFRVDAVAAMIYLDYSRKEGEWVPNRYGGHENLEAIDFLREFNVLTHAYFPGVLTIAEESTSFGGVSLPVDHGGLGFDFKWNMGWMHDTLHYFSRDPIHRKFHHNQLTFAMLYQYSEHFVLALSHDEVVYGKSSLFSKMPSWELTQKAHMLRSLLGYMWMWPGKKSLFMGGEFGQTDEWYYEKSLDWHLLKYMDHEGIRRWVKDLNALYRRFTWLGKYDDEPRGFSWVNPNDGDNSVLSFLRHGENERDMLLVVGNFTPVAREHYRVGVPVSGKWMELLNSNATLYGGNGCGNLGERSTEDIPWNAQRHSLDLYLPPLSIVVFRVPQCG